MFFPSFAGIPGIAWLFIAWIIVTAWFEWHVPPEERFSESPLLGGIVVVTFHWIFGLFWTISQIPP